MSKPMLIEALKPGMRAKLGNGEEVWRTENYIRSKTITKICNVVYLTSTDYEIIPDDPKPWTPTKGHGGFAVMPYMGDIELLPGNSDHWKFALKTMEAAKQKAKLDRIHTAILNMPDSFEGSDRNPFSITIHQEHCCVVVAARFPFSGEDANNAAYHAYKYANAMCEVAK